MHEVRAPVSERIRLVLRRDFHRQSLPLPRLAIPGLALRINASALPHRQFADMRPGLIPTRDEHRVLLCNAFERLCGRQPFDLRWIVRWPDDNEVVVHHQTTRGCIPLLHPCLLGCWGMGQDDVTFPTGALLEDVTATGTDGLGAPACRLFEGLREVLENSAILCRCGGKDDNFAQRSLSTRRGGENHPQDADQSEYSTEAWHSSHCSSS